MKLTLPLPPSANRYWRNWRGRTVVSPEATAYKASVYRLLVGNRTPIEFEPETRPVSVVAHVYRGRKSGDLDNRLKVLLDSLRGILFADDSQVKHIEARLFDDKRNPRVELSVEVME